jgi:hypothetical protein
VAQLNSQALGSLFIAFIAFYDSQGCGGGILTRLHTRTERINNFNFSKTKSIINYFTEQNLRIIESNIYERNPAGS